MDLTLISEVVALLKESFSQLKNNELSTKEKNKIESFLKFLQEKVFAEIPEGMTLYTQLEKNIEDEKNIETIKSEIEKFVNKDLQKEIEDQIVELHKNEELEQIEITQQDSTILVPWDFTTLAEYALEHAVLYSKTINGKIVLLHIIKKEKERASALIKLDGAIEKAQKEYGVTPEVIVKVGTIFTEITAVSTEVNADLVIMGTHGVKGMQKITGSWALKVIADTVAPFIVVQSPPSRKNLEKILFPVDYRKEIRQKLNQARYLTHFYNPTIHLCYPGSIGIETTKRKTINNLKFIENYFDTSNIKYETHKVEGAKDFGDATIKVAKELEPDIIMTLTTKDIGFTNYILGAEEQKIIANPMKFPVMCINPKHGKWSHMTR